MMIPGTLRSAPRRRARKLRQTGSVVVAAVFLLAALGACTTAHRDVPRPYSEAWLHPEATWLGRELGGRVSGQPGQSGVYPLVWGMEALTIRASLAESAERTLDLQYYSLGQDITTDLLLFRVLRAAQRGVRVRLLVDDLYALGRDFDLATFSAHPNIEVRVFNPFLNRGGWGLSQLLEYLGDPSRLNRRMHNKLWIADNAVAIMGGRNLGDEYFDASNEVNFADLDILLAGPVVPEVSRSFDAYWNSEWAVPIDAFVATTASPDQIAAFERALAARMEGFRDSEFAQALREARFGFWLRSGQLALTPVQASIVYDAPQKISGSGDNPSSRQVFSSHMRPILAVAQRELILISPYFIPSEEGIAVLRSLVQRGLRVRVLTNSLASTDYVPLAHSGYARWRARLLAAGLELHEMRPDTPDMPRKWRPGAPSGAYLHTKAIVVDRRHVVLGSMNLDPRSRQDNTEVALLLDSNVLGDRLAALFEDAVRPAHAFRLALSGHGEEHGIIWITEERGTEVRYDDEPLTGFWRRSSRICWVCSPPKTCSEAARPPGLSTARPRCPDTDGFGRIAFGAALHPHPAPRSVALL